MSEHNDLHKNNFTDRERAAYRGMPKETDIEGPRRLYRVTSSADSPEQRGGNPRGGWWVSEQQMAGFVDPKTKEFDQERWRAWSAVQTQWNPKADQIHVLELKEGEHVKATVGQAKYQNENPKVAYMGNAEQTYLHEVPSVKSYDVNSPEGKRAMQDVADRNPERVGRLYEPRDPDPRDPTPGSPTPNRRNQASPEEDNRLTSLRDRKASVASIETPEKSMAALPKEPPAKSRSR